MKDYQWYAIAVYAGIFLLGWLFRGGMEDSDEENSPTSNIWRANGSTNCYR